MRDPVNKELEDALKSFIEAMNKSETWERGFVLDDLKHEWCPHCGSLDTCCQCWNDE